MNNDKNYIQLIYRLILIVISFGFLSIIWPFISSVVTMLIFAFLFTTILLPLVDQLESKIKSRGISIVIVTISIITTFVIFLIDGKLLPILSSTPFTKPPSFPK